MKAIGIDLGTTNSVAAYDDGHELRILPTSTHEQFTPSVVSLGNDGLLVGRQAWNNAAAAPTDTIFSIKRLMGRSFDEKQVDEAKKRYAYTIVAGEKRGVAVQIGGNTYTPEDISTMILRQVVKDASAALNDQVTHAVITVPAYFNDHQREATRKAGEKAGLIVKKIIDEPTAAAVAFGMQQAGKEHTLLVFDMGGGTLDVSIGYMDSRSEGDANTLQFVGMAIGGDKWLGGDDLDHAIVEMIHEWVGQTFDLDLRADKRFIMQARREAERVKCLLSERREADVGIPGAILLPGGQAASVRMTITQRAFEERITPYVERARVEVRKTMAIKDLDPDDISTVLLVGGATYVPAVRQMLENIFGADKVKHHVNPMLAVAQGAATLAAKLKGVVCPIKACGRQNDYDARECVACGASLATAQPIGDVGMYEITERDMGISVVRNGLPDAFSVLIKRGTPYPLKEPMRRPYFTTSHQITIPVYAGESLVASQNEYLGLVEYKLPADAPPRTPIEVQFNYDRDRILRVRIEVKGRPELTHEMTPTRYAPDPQQSSDDLWRTTLQNAIKFIEMLLDRYHDFIEHEQRERLKDGIRRAGLVLAGQDQAIGQQMLHELTQAIGELDIAYRLLLTDIKMQEVDPQTAQYLAQQSKRLRDAYRSNDVDMVRKVKRTLDAELMHIAEAAPTGPDIKGFGGLLEDLSAASKEDSDGTHLEERRADN